MHTILGVPLAFIWPQLLLGLINGSFYAMLSMGLAIIFGMLNIINFLHGAFYMLGAFFSWMALQYLGIGFWPSLVLAPLCVAAVGLVLERALIRRVYDLDPLYGLLLTFGLALVIEGVFRNFFGSAGGPTPFRKHCPASSIWASWFCRFTGPGLSARRPRCAWVLG